MSAPVEASPKPRIDWLTLAQFSLGAAAIGGAWLVVLTGSLGAWLNSYDLPSGNTRVLSSFVLIAGVLLISALLFPSMLHALRRILNLESRPFRFFGPRFGLVVLLIPVVVYLGVQSQTAGLGAVSILLHLAGALLTIGWLLWLALRDLPLGSAQRAWGSLAAGLSATPPLAFIIEALGLLALVLIFSIYTQINPQISQLIERMALSNSSPEDISVLAPFLNDPVVLLLIATGIAVLAPVVEELLKPLGVYLLLNRKLSDAQGFIAGALCGSGYAMIENLTLNTDPGTLAVVALGRFGASAMHIVTAAMMGLALARSKRSGKWLPLLGTLAVNVFVHGSWNALVLLSAAGQLTMNQGTGLVPQQLQSAGPILLGLLALGCVIALVRLNRKMVEQQAELFVKFL